jgi:hypothetical protein
MTQYPSPLQYGQTYPYGSFPDPRLPARRAGVLMIVLGVLLLLMGGCIAAVGAALPSFRDQMPAEQRQVFDDLEHRFNFSLQGVMVAMGIITLAIGLANIILGILVRKGGIGTVVGSLVLTSISILFILLNIFGAVMQGANGAVGLCFWVVALALFVLLLVWLIQAARASSKIDLMQQQYQAQYSQYQQAWQQYGQTGYPQGYGYPQPPPPAPPAPQPPGNEPPPPQQ